MEVEKVRQALKLYDGNWSQLYRLIKNEVDWDSYEKEDVAFKQECLGFEDDYFNYFLHMVDNHLIPDRVIDIGCSIGLQAYIFVDHMKYVGIDYCQYPVDKIKNTTFLCEIFPHLNLSLKDETVISNMSLGFFNKYSNDITDDVIVEKLSECKNLYIGSTQKITDALKPYFKTRQQFNGDGIFQRFYFGKE